eukprot:GHVP01008757.1.p1 GENE.GHVP01008757.1~~GHVP01008757.1.p1  ORF type:complete len:104 (+),score=10.46 GHVP01008757.1:145-456(+)
MPVASLHPTGRHTFSLTNLLKELPTYSIAEYMTPFESLGAEYESMASTLDSTGLAPSLEMMCPRYFRDLAPKMDFSTFMDNPLPLSEVRHPSVLTRISSKVIA